MKTLLVEDSPVSLMSGRLAPQRAPHEVTTLPAGGTRRPI
jgi:hypothetical protein